MTTRIVMCLLLTCANAAALEARRLDVLAGDIVRSLDGRGVIVSLRDASGGAVSELNPFTLQFDPERTAVIGGTPGRMAMDDDGSVVYVTLDAAAAVSRVRLDTFTEDLRFDLGSVSDPLGEGPMFALDLAVLPGGPGSIAVTGVRDVGQPDRAHVAVFDEGVRRSQMAEPVWAVTSITTGADASRVYGQNGNSTEFGFRRFAVDADGVTLIDVTPDLLGGSFRTDITFAGGRVYGSSGRIVDPEARTIVATLPVTGDATATSVDLAANRIYVVDGDVIRAYDATTFVLLESWEVPGLLDRFGHGQAVDLVNVGSDRFVVRTVTNALVVVATSFAACADDAECQDLQVCTVDRCQAGACVHSPLPCGDGVCVIGHCVDHVGCETSPASLGTPCTSDGDPCTFDICDGEGTCDHRPEQTRIRRAGCRLVRIRDLLGSLDSTRCDAACRTELTVQLVRTEGVLNAVERAATSARCDKLLSRTRQKARAFRRVVRRMAKAAQLDAQLADAYEAEIDALVDEDLGPGATCGSVL